MELANNKNMRKKNQWRICDIHSGKSKNFNLKIKRSFRHTKFPFSGLVKGGLTVLISVLIIFTVVQAGTITPPGGEPVATFYSLTEIYNFITANTPATVGNPALDWSANLEGTGRTLTEIYNALTGLISASKVFTGTTYLGTTGTLKLACATSTFDGNANLVANDYDGDGNGTDRWCITDAEDITIADVLFGKIAWINGATTTGTMANNGVFALTASSSNQSVTAGYYSGGTLLGDADLAEGNIKSGENIFDVTGTYSGTPGLPATGQTIDTYGTSRTCGDGGTGTCEDGYYKSGLALSYSNVEVGANPQYVAVNDLNTGLMWQKCSAGLSDTDKANTCGTGTVATLAWKTAGNITEAIDYCENLELCNDGTFQGDKTTEGDCSSHSGALYIDWRLPNIKELLSLVKDDAGNGTPYLNKTFFPGTVSNYYWSSTTSPGQTTAALSVRFSTGYGSYAAKDTLYYVRCVREP